MVRDKVDKATRKNNLRKKKKGHCFRPRCERVRSCRDTGLFLLCSSLSKASTSSRRTIIVD